MITISISCNINCIKLINANVNSGLDQIATDRYIFKASDHAYFCSKIPTVPCVSQST